MNLTLPLGIENYLEECGFTGTEIIILRKLLEGNSLTVRELAVKSGKGNGVVDAALKKLIRRGIVGTEKLNERNRYVILDTQAIVAWTKKNLKDHTEMMERKHQSFSQFMKNISVAKNHPEIEHFSGRDGLMQSYDRLLANRTELLTFFDPTSIQDADALSEFRASYFRRRQVYGVFQRVIAPDTPIARRFRTRDPFEYRCTMLMPAENYPLSFTKIIAGDTVACINEQNAEASFIRFPQLAQSERIAFERLWREQTKNNQKTGAAPQAAAIPFHDSISLNILQKICVAFFGLLLVAWCGLFLMKSTGGFYNYLYSFLFGLIPLFSGVAGMLHLKVWGGLKTAIGKSVFFMSLGVFLWGCGEMIWSYYNFFLGVAAPYPSIADIPFAPSIFFISLGVAFLADAAGAKTGLKSLNAKIFVIVVPIVTFFVSYYALINVARGGVLTSAGGNPLKMILDIAYPLEDFFALTIAALISGLSFKYMEGRYTFDIIAILLGLGVMFVGDFVFSYTTTVGSYYNGDFGDLILTIGVFLLSFGVLGFCGEKPAPSMRFSNSH